MLDFATSLRLMKIWWGYHRLPNTKNRTICYDLQLFQHVYRTYLDLPFVFKMCTFLPKKNCQKAGRSRYMFSVGKHSQKLPKPRPRLLLFHIKILCKTALQQRPQNFWRSHGIIFSWMQIDRESSNPKCKLSSMKTKKNTTFWGTNGLTLYKLQACMPPMNHRFQKKNMLENILRKIASKMILIIVPCNCLEPQHLWEKNDT